MNDCPRCQGRIEYNVPNPYFPGSVRQLVCEPCRAAQETEWDRAEIAAISAYLPQPNDAGLLWVLGEARTRTSRNEASRNEA